jgi:hypothetical protein
MAEDQGYAFDWDSEIENDGNEFVLFPACEAIIEVVEMERAVVSNGKYTGSPMAKLKLRATHPEHGTTTINENLILHSNMEWKMCQFFTCIGQRQHGEKLRPRWQEVVGSTGRVKVLVDEYQATDKAGNKVVRQNNKIDKWMDPLPASSAKAVKADPLPITDEDF